MLVLVLACPLVVPASLILVVVSLVVPPQLDPRLVLLVLVIFDVIADLHMLRDLFRGGICSVGLFLLVDWLRLFGRSFILLVARSRGLFILVDAACRASGQFLSDVSLLATTFRLWVVQALGLLGIIEFERGDDLRLLLGYLLFGGHLSQIDGELQEVASELEFPVL